MANATLVIHNNPYELLPEGATKTVTLKVVNAIVEPFFELSKTLTTRYMYLHGIMEQAAEGDPRFGFAVKFCGGQLGYSVMEYHNLRADYTVDGRCIYIRDEEGRLTGGIEDYIPNDTQTIRFEFNNV